MFYELSLCELIKPAETIQLSTHSLATLHALFLEDPEERSKRINWDAFVDSMNNAGFFAKNKGGSDVTFEHPSEAGSDEFTFTYISLTAHDGCFRRCLRTRHQSYFTTPYSLLTMKSREYEERLEKRLREVQQNSPIPETLNIGNMPQSYECANRTPEIEPENRFRWTSTLTD